MVQNNPWCVSSYDTCPKRLTSKMPESPLIINEWYLNSYHCIIYWQFLSSPSGAVVPWHLTNSYVVGRRPFHLKPDHAPGTDRERWMKAHRWRFHPSHCFYWVSTTQTRTHDQAFGASAHANTHRCKSECSYNVMHHFTSASKPDCSIRNILLYV